MEDGREGKWRVELNGSRLYDVSKRSLNSEETRDDCQKMVLEFADSSSDGLRAGYFSDRPNATRFCERIRQMGQDCIVVAR